MKTTLEEKRKELHLIPLPNMDFNKSNKITVVDLIAICRCHMVLSRLDCQTRAKLYTAIQNQNSYVQKAIDIGVEMAIGGGLVKYAKFW